MIILEATRVRAEREPLSERTIAVEPHVRLARSA